MTSPCRISGPYLPVGDVDWECREHRTIALPRDPVALRARVDAGGSPRRDDFRCPVSEPQPGDDELLAGPSWENYLRMLEPKIHYTLNNSDRSKESR